jgi:hypothetical protein
MRVAVLGGYGPGQSVGGVFRAFKRAGHEVMHWPTFPDFNPAIVEKAELPDLLFTFKIGLDHVPRGFIKSLKVPTKIFWSFDDPHWIKYSKSKSIWHAQEHGIVFTSCRGSIEDYKKQGCPRAYFMPPAMDLEVYNPDLYLRNWEKYLASFICTNLYPISAFPHNFLDRKEMVDRLYAAFGKDFALYGFNRGIADHPACRGQVQWENTLPAAICATRMNIENHAYNSDDLYFNERFFQIVSTRKAMFLDRCSGFTDLFGEEDENFIWYSSLDELVDRLRFYKEQTALLEEIGQNGFDRLREWTYDKFVKQVMWAAEGLTPYPSFL